MLFLATIFVVIFCNSRNCFIYLSTYYEYRIRNINSFLYWWVMLPWTLLYFLVASHFVINSTWEGGVCIKVRICFGCIRVVLLFPNKLSAHCSYLGSKWETIDIFWWSLFSPECGCIFLRSVGFYCQYFYSFYVS